MLKHLQAYNKDLGLDIKSFKHILYTLDNTLKLVPGHPRTSMLEKIRYLTLLWIS